MQRSNSTSSPFRSIRFVSTLLVLVASTVGCSATYPRADPTGRLFPTIAAKTLENRSVEIPTDFKGQEIVLFVGYKMDSQFDIDRWLLGLHQINLDVLIYELPTIPGLIPGMFGGSIDNGMRSGIPMEDWGIVATVYDDAEVVSKFLGNETPLPARVVLLDQEGRVSFFHDRGYSTSSLIRLQKALDALRHGGH